MADSGNHRTRISTSVVAIAGAAATVAIAALVVTNYYYHDFFSKQIYSDPGKPPVEGSPSAFESPNSQSTNSVNNNTNILANKVNQTRVDVDQAQQQIFTGARSIDSKIFQLSKSMKTVQSQVENQDYDSATSEIEKSSNLTSDIVRLQQDILANYQNLLGQPIDGVSSNGNDTQNPYGMKTTQNKSLSANSDLHLFQKLDQIDGKLAALLSAQRSLYLLYLGTSPAPSSEEHKLHSQIEDTKKNLDTAFSLLNESKTAEKSLFTTLDSLNSSNTTTNKLDITRNSSLTKLDRVLTITRDIVHSLNEQNINASLNQSELNNLRNYTLTRINDDRKLSNLNAVKLSSNLAAQIQAQDILKTGEISHWMTTGEKPYMTYTRFGGLGFVDQNVAVGGYSQYRECSSSIKTPDECDKIEPTKSIDALEYDMMYNDLKCCDDGHRINILDKFHNDVSIGIAHNDYFLVLVENFENNYIASNDKPVALDNNTVIVTGDLQQAKPLSVTVQFDEIPTGSVYDSNKDRDSYDMGTLLATIYDSEEFKYRSQSPTSKAIEAQEWQVNPGEFKIKFDISTLTSRLPPSQENAHSGVLTIVLWSYGKDGDSTEFPVTSYSMTI